MRDLIIFFVCILSIKVSMGQIYERTGKNIGMYISAQPVSQIIEKGSFSQLNCLSGSVGVVHMLKPGIYPSIGYTFNKSQQIIGRNESTFPLQDAHIIDASLILDKQILKLLNGKRVMGGCHYLSLGFIIGPEYHYLFGNSMIKNVGFGEIAGTVGLSFYHYKKSMRKKVKANTRQYDIFFRKGFTPILSTSIDGAEKNYFRQEIGIRIRLVRHQVYNFLK